MPRIVAFALRARGSGRGGALTITNSVSTIDLTVTYNDGRGSGWRELRARRRTRGFQTRRLIACFRSPTGATLRLFIPRARLGAATPGIYRGSLALTIVPE